MVTHFGMVFRDILKHIESSPAALKLLLGGLWVLCLTLIGFISAFCFKVLLVEPLQWTYHIPWGWEISIWEFLMGLALLKLCTLGLSYAHWAYARQLTGEQAYFHDAWALRFSSRNTKALLAMAQFYIQRQDLEQGRQFCERVLALEPTEEMAYKYLGHAYLKQGEGQKACAQFETGYRIARGVAWNDLPEYIPSHIQDPPDTAIVTTSLKLNHDLQQLDFLLKGQYVPKSFEKVKQLYEQALREVHSHSESQVTLSPSLSESLRLFYGRNVYFSAVPAFPQAVLEQRDWSQVVHDFNTQGWAVVDQVLRFDVQESLLHFCEKSTIWHDDKRPGQYLGAYMDDGFHCALLFQLAAEFQSAMPSLFKDTHLKHMWAYKYANQSDGIGVHADDAKMNVNLWLTDTDANLEPERGGLVIYPVAAPDEWHFEKMNIDTPSIEAHIAQSQVEPVTIPHKQNRMILFNSRFFHVTDKVNFKPGYTSRRINITFLYA